jgi:hypothetical protein
MIKLLKIISLMKERATFVKDIYNEGKFFFEAPISYDEKASKKSLERRNFTILKELITKLESLEDFSSERIKEEIHHLVRRKRVGLWQSNDAFKTIFSRRIERTRRSRFSRNPWKGWKPSAE